MVRGAPRRQGDAAGSERFRGVPHHRGVGLSAELPGGASPRAGREKSAGGKRGPGEAGDGAAALTVAWLLTREAGEGDRRRRWRGRVPSESACAAWLLPGARGGGGECRSAALDDLPPPPCFAWSPS